MLAGELTNRLTERSVRFGQARLIDAKGIGLVTAWPALSVASGVPEGRPTIEGLRARLVGRRSELRALRDAHTRITSDRRAMLVTLLGAPGVGKTRLAEEFIAQLGLSSVMRGRCLPYGEGAATYPVEQMLRADAGIDLGDSQAAAARKMRERVADVVGVDDELDAIQRRIVVQAGIAAASEELRDIPSPDIAEELRWSFRRYLERRAASSPATLVFEDIHWAAPPVLDLIEHLADWVRAPLLLLCLARPELLERRLGWGTGRQRGTVIDVAPLDSAATAELIRALLPVALPSEKLQQEVIARSEGNPLYVEEVVRALIETGQIIREEGRWVSLPVTRMKVPLTLQGLIAARLDRVSTDAKRLLQDASVIGRSFSSSALAALHPGPVASALREALGSELVTEEEAWTRGRGALFRFGHVLFREVAYGMLPKADRARLHDRYRSWLEGTVGERRDELIEVIADHAEQAHQLATEVRLPDAAGFARIAFERLRDSANRARDRGDLRSALDLWRRAKTVGDTFALGTSEQIQTDENLLLLRTSFENGDDLWRDIDVVLDRARATGPSESFVRLLIANGWRMFKSTVQRSSKLMEEALAAAKDLGDHELITYALLQQPVVALARGELEEVTKRHEETLAYAKSHGVTRELSACLRALALWALRSGAFTRATTLLAEAEQLAQRTGSKAALFAVLTARAEVAIWTGPWDDAVERARRLEALAADLATHEAHIDHLNLLGLALFEAGDLQAARSAQASAMRITEPHSFEFTYALFNMLFTLIGLGDVREARRLYETVEPVDLPWQNYHAMHATVAATLNAAEDKVDSSEALYRQAIAIFETATTAPTRWHWAQQLYAELLLKQNRLVEARSLLEAVRNFYSDPLAAPRRARIEILLARTQRIHID